MNDWPILKKAPVVTAIFQIKFDMGAATLEDFLEYDKSIREILPEKSGNIAANINFNGTSIPLGVSKVTGTSTARVDIYRYFSTDQKQKLEISEGTITYIDESEYVSWDNFTHKVFNLLSKINQVLEQHTITRTSIRFVNKFDLDTNINPIEYFKTIISTTEDNVVPYPLSQFSFKMRLNVSDTISANVNQSMEQVQAKYIYIFDIDVLEHRNLIFEINSIKRVLDGLRVVKNELFFHNVTDKLIELCS